VIVAVVTVVTVVTVVAVKLFLWWLLLKKPYFDQELGQTWHNETEL